MRVAMADISQTQANLSAIQANADAAANSQQTTPAPETDKAANPPKHRLYEDAIALVLGTLIVSLGVTLYTQAVLITGSTAGAALLIHHASGLDFGIIFFALNLPFYWLSFKRMGWEFTLKTFIAVGLVSAFSRLTPIWINIDTLHPLYAALIGGGLMGVGLLMLFRHRAGLGGINILALYLQEHHGIRAGYFQLGIDASIMVCALFLLPWDKVLLSLAGAMVLNLIIAMNHRPGRYFSAR
tara:strand:+ start:11838 stop:12560 length:723 start_codon:yes stop_codon:yes gene_type:complete